MSSNIPKWRLLQQTQYMFPSELSKSIVEKQQFRKGVKMSDLSNIFVRLRADTFESVSDSVPVRTSSREGATYIEQ